ncbi:MAG: TetR/AcrR family transcriptional regulator [Chitinophagales bacterium]
MPIKERRKREKQELRQAILDVAKDIAAKDGWQNVTIRKICDKVKYTAPVIYHYFENKEMILQSLREEGFKQVFGQFDAVDNKYKKAEKRLTEYALVWWNFALVNPELYQVMFNLQGAVCDLNESVKNPQSRLVIEYYTAAFSQINQKAKRSEKYTLELCDNLISIIHGFIAMRMVNKIRSGNENAEQVFKNALQRFIHSINDIK